MITSEICSGLMPLRASSALMTCAPRSEAGIFAIEPLNLPTAVRSAAVITTSFITFSPVRITEFGPPPPTHFHFVVHRYYRPALKGCWGPQCLHGRGGSDL